MEDELTFKDVTGETVTVPEGTLWLNSNITNPLVEDEINNKEIVAYSVTISEKEDAEEVIDIYNHLKTGTANKQGYHGKLEEINKKITTKRTLIKDIKDPVMLTVSVVKFPCVNKAKFCEKSIKKVNTKEVEKMSDKQTENKNNANINFINSIKSAVNEFRNSTEEETKNMTEEENVSAEIDGKIEAMKSEIEAEIAQNHEELLSAIKNLQTAPTINEEEQELVDDGTNEEGITPPVNEEQKEPEEKEEDEEKEEEPPKKEQNRKGKGGKSKKGKEKIVYAQPSAQQSRKNAKLENEEQKMTHKRNEDDVIYDAVKGGMSLKGLNMEEVDLTGTGLTNKYENEVFLSLLNNKYASEVYKASFSEENSNKAILTTNVFSTFVTKLIQEEPIFLDAAYQTGHHGKGYIYDLDNGTYDTEDGHLPENFYFDSDPSDDEFDIDVREIRCYTQRRRVTISDRQRLSNVYGDDLVNKVLDISRKKLYRGVYAARVWSDTTLANSVDKQYRRQDGLLKQAGQQLGESDVNLDKPVDIFRTMFYALPEEARTPSDYTFYVPTNVFLAYYDYISESKKESRYEWISQEQTLRWNNIPVKVSPTLNRADMKTLTYNGDSAVLLTNPQNTNLIVGREAGIEPKRNADTSSDTFYETIDTGVVYSQPDYAVTLTIGADSYEGLIGQSEGGDQP